MTDEQMDARLHAAGEAWRTATPPADEITPVEPHGLTTPDVPRRHRHRTGLLASAAIVAAALVAGGAVLVSNISGNDNGRGADTETAAPLEGTVWRFLGYGDHLQQSSLATLYISPDGQLVADDSCDLIGGKVSSPAGDQGQLYVTDFEMRYYNCTDSVGEVTFDLDVLTSAPRYTLGETGTLTITGAGKTMHLIAAPDLPPPTLDRPTATGATWKLTTVTNGNGSELPVHGDATFRIANDQLRASDTCNTLSGDAVIDWPSLSTKQLAITAIGCSPDVATTAAVVDAVLQGGAKVEQTGAQLVLRAAGVGTLHYEWVPDDAVATNPANLTDRTWHLTSAAGDPVTDKVTLRIAPDGSATVFNGCVINDAHADVSPGTLVMSRLSTAKFGPGCNYDLATTVDSLLTQHPALWRVDNGDLVINGPGAQAFALVFASGGSAPPTTLTPLAGTEWELTSIETGTDPNAVVTSVPPGLGIRIAGGSPAQLGFGCQVADVTIGHGSMDIGEFHDADPRMLGCTMFGTQEIHTVLSGNVSWVIEGERLTITKDGVGALVFTAQVRPGNSRRSP